MVYKDLALQYPSMHILSYLTQPILKCYKTNYTYFIAMHTFSKYSY